MFCSLVLSSRRNFPVFESLFFLEYYTKRVKNFTNYYVSQALSAQCDVFSVQSRMLMMKTGILKSSTDFLISTNFT